MAKEVLAVMPNDFSVVLQKRTAVLLNMERCRLEQKWVHVFSLPEISACCRRIKEHLGDMAVYQGEIQEELLRNTAFAAYYAELLKTFPEEPPAEEKPTPVRPYRGGYGYSYSRPAASLPPSRRAVLEKRLAAFLKILRTAAIDITHVSRDELMEALETDDLTDTQRLDYLRHVAPMKLSKEERAIAVASITNCVELPAELNDGEKRLLLKRATGDRALFASAPFAEVSRLLSAYPLLENIADFLTEMEIGDQLEFEEYTQFSQNAPEYHRLILSILGCLEPETAADFMRYWRNSGYPLHELQTMERRLASEMDLDLAEVFSSYAGYVNLLYGKRFKSIDFTSITGSQESILLYAIVKNKKHFIRMVDNDPEALLSVPSTSILFNASFYQEHFNLNELTEKDMADCAWMSNRRLHVEALAPGRIYTFPEIRTLYDTGEAYIALYNRLASPRQDYRLMVIRQFIKRKLLRKRFDTEGLDALANKLDRKPLDRWMQEDFKMVKDLDASNAVELLIHFDTVQHILPTLEIREDAILVLRHLECIDQIDTLSALKKHAAETDIDWKSLSNVMDLTDDFKARHMSEISRFICNNGAYISWQYQRNLEPTQREAFLRVVKAELMGQLSTLKYFEGDLQKELDQDISEQTIARWKENTGLSQNDITVKEYDDFLSTMLLGVQPHRTCLAYDSGIYKKCLLSGFDSNKKVLYAEINGKRVGRAYLRLTKGQIGETSENRKNGSFTFVDVEDMEARRIESELCGEQLTLFLERPYYSGVDQQAETKIGDLLIELASRKADALGAILVLSDDYRGIRSEGFTCTKFSVYISRTKAGAQYLDSLGGEATVDTEGHYQSNIFLVRSTDIPE